MMKSWAFLQALEFLVPPSTTGSWDQGGGIDIVGAS